MKSLRIFFPLVATFLALEASGAVLVQQSAPTWRWRAGITEASAPVSAWRTLGFDDSQFTTAPAPFWFGDALPGGTQILGMQNVYTSLFLRITFELTNTAEIAYLRLGALVDDGFVAWINGTEVQRVRVPGAAGSPVSIAMLADNAPEPPPFTLYTLPTPPSYLLVGSNVLAVQVFQSSAGSSDLGFDASLESVFVETIPPTVLSASPSAGSTVGGLSAITVTFSEPVNGVDAADFLINGVASSSVTPLSSTAYAFGFAQPAYGTVQISWNPSHGITDQAIPPNPFNATGPGAMWQYNLVDQAPPTVATLSPAADATVRELTSITVVFSESVTGVDAADLRINNTPATGLSGAADVYTITFPQPATGLVQVVWAAGHGITDLATAPNAFVPGGSWFYTLDPNAADGSGPVISEFLAANTNSPSAYLDEDGDSSDWIEIQNTGDSTANLLDWSLTDEADKLTKWRFPATNLPPGGFLVVFASEKDRRVPGARLHTNFKLDDDGEYLALVRPDGSIASEFAPFPQQVSQVSFGLGVLSSNSTLVSTTAQVRVQIPSSGADGTNWLYPGFNDGAWTLGTNGVGYGTTNVTAADYGAAVLPTGPVGYWRLDENSGSTAANIGSGAGLDGTYTSATLGTAGPRPPLFNGFEADNDAPTFNGSSTFVSIPSPVLNNRSTFTIAGWIRPAVAQANRTGLFGQNDLVEFGFISATTIQLWTFVGQIDFAYPFAVGQWHHIAGVGTGSQLQLYLDGTERISVPMSGAIGTSAFNFNIGGGGIFDNIGNFFNGQMDEVAVYHRALSSAELLSLYQAGINGPVSVVPFIRTDVAAAMSNLNASAYIRLPFNIDNPANVQLLSLRARFDDGFVASLNGIEFARANAPGALTFNSAATNTHTANTVDLFQSGGALLRPGANVLAIQGLNAAAADADFLVSAELTATHVAAAASAGVYMTVPSPGAPNASGVTILGPAITEPSHSPNVPLDSQDVLVTARVSPTFALVGSVAVRYRIMFGAEAELPMFDDGMHGDGLPDDGLYGQTLPVAAGSTNGQMIRWYFRAADGLGNVSRWPLFVGGGDPEYLGTIVNPTNVVTPLPVFHIFIAPNQVAGIDTESGGRISFFHDGEFYDNVYMELRGNTSAGLPKKAHRLEFNRDHELRHPGPGPRVRKTSLLAEYPDPSRLRQHLSFWFLNLIGVPSAFDYPVRVQTNGVFYQIAFHNDVIGQEQVERLGYDPRGALYKAVGNADTDYSSTGGFQKLEPDNVTSRADYDELARGISDIATNPLSNRRVTVFQYLDVPEVINYLTGARWVSENDDVWANMSLYHDTFGDRLWRVIPFDMNPSWGQRYGGVSVLEASVDTQKSHPLYGGRAIDPIEGGPADYFNRVYDVIISVPETRQMLLRRMRTVMDKWVLPPGTPTNQLIIENYIKSLTNLMGTDMLLETPPRWPAYSAWGPVEPFVPACANILANFVPQRRTHWYVTHCITNTSRPIGTNSNQNAGIPLTQSVLASIAVGSVEANPASANQEQEFVCITNLTPSAAVDISEWKLDGGVEFKFKPGTVIPSNSVIYVSPNVVAFKQRTTGPRGSNGLFVVGPFKGQLSARGEPLTLRDDKGRLVYSNTYPAAPSSVQEFLRVSEIMYNPSALAGNTNNPQEFEYIELVNTSPSATLNLNGVRLTNGVDFAFTGSAVTSLGPNGRVVVVRNLAAFAARYPSAPSVAGQYSGLLDNAGERIRLLDAANEEVLDFSYNNSWYPITDGHGFSLVNTNLGGEPDSWGDKSSWRPSGILQGAPGLSDPPGPVFAPIRINEVLTHTDAPQRDTIELFNPTTDPVNLGGWFLSDDFTNGMKFRITNGCMIPAGGFLTFDETLFTNAATALVPFALSSLGDEIFVFSGDPASTNLTGYHHGFDFNAADNGVSFGLHVDGQTNEHFVAQKTLSLGSANAGPRVGPVVISEIMYHPLDYGDGSDNSVDEFIELRSVTNAPTPLFTPTNNWRLSGGISFDFPFGATLGANTSLVVVAFNPTNGTQLASFRSRFNVPEGVAVYGPFGGKLDNSSDTVRLLKPGEVGPGGAPSFIRVDEVDYEDSAPWPAGADGSGASLQRRVAGDFGNDPDNWVAAVVTGSGLWSGGALPTISAHPSSTMAGLGSSAMFSVSASGPGPLGYQWRFNGNSIAGANSSILMLSGIDFFDEGYYDVVVYNAAGSVLSGSAGLSVFIPATILIQPQSVNIRVPPDPGAAVNNRNVSFSVLAESTTPITYQWRKDGMILPGATGTTLTISNVVLEDRGAYSVLVTDAAGTVPSANATLTPWIASTFVERPALNHTNPVSTPFTVSSVITGWPPPLTIYYRSNSALVARSDTSNFVNFFTYPAQFASRAAGSNWYRIVVSNVASTGSGLATHTTNHTRIDFDMDGLPDLYEVQYGLNTNNMADAFDDLDGDQMTNLAEFIAGTDPSDLASFLKIEQTTVPGQATLRFGAIPNKTYTLQYADALPAGPTGWFRLADFASRTNAHVESVQDPNWSTNRFYRVATPWQP